MTPRGFWKKLFYTTFLASEGCKISSCPFCYRSITSMFSITLMSVFIILWPASVCVSLSSHALLSITLNGLHLPWKRLPKRVASFYFSLKLCYLISELHLQRPTAKKNMVKLLGLKGRSLAHMWGIGTWFNKQLDIQLCSQPASLNLSSNLTTSNLLSPSKNI